MRGGGEQKRKSWIIKNKFCSKPTLYKFFEVYFLENSFFREEVLKGDIRRICDRFYSFRILYEFDYAVNSALPNKIWCTEYSGYNILAQSIKLNSVLF